MTPEIKRLIEAARRNRAIEEKIAEWAMDCVRRGNVTSWFIGELWAIIRDALAALDKGGDAVERSARAAPAPKSKTLNDWLNEMDDGYEGERTFIIKARKRGIETSLWYTAAPAPLTPDKADALNDSAYIAGAKAGYNLGVVENHEGLAALVHARGGYLKVLKQAPTAVSAEPERIECVQTVGIDPNYPAPPLYRVMVGRRCFDFADEQEARNLITAIRELMTAPAPLTPEDYVRAGLNEAAKYARTWKVVVNGCFLGTLESLADAISSFDPSSIARAAEQHKC